MYAEAYVSTQTSSNSATGDFLRVMQAALAGAGTPESLQQPGALHQLGQTLYDQALIVAFRDAFLIVAIVFL